MYVSKNLKETNAFVFLIPFLTPDSSPTTNAWQ